MSIFPYQLSFEVHYIVSNVYYFTQCSPKNPKSKLRLLNHPKANARNLTPSFQSDSPNSPDFSLISETGKKMKPRSLPKSRN